MKLAVKIFLVLFGLSFIGLGYFVGIVMAGDARNAVRQANELAPVSAAALAESALGSPVLVEGALSVQNEVRFRDFVAYVRQEFRGADSDGNERWIEDERVTPRLLIETGGMVRLANEDYTLSGPHAYWAEEGLNWSSRTEEGTKRYSGLVAERPVLAIGEVVAGPTGNELQARLLYGGTRSQYIEEQQSSADWLGWIGIDVAIFGVAVIGLGLWGLRRWR